jgi:cell division septation protein DedD
MSLHFDDDYDEPAPRTTELTLSTGTILGALFGLALLCALFFWFGYSMRGGSKASPLPTAQVVEPTSPDATFNTFKPAAGSPLNASTTPPPAPTPIPARSPATTPQPASQPAPIVARPAPAAATPTQTTVTTPSSTGFYVQVAAVSHQQEADKLAGTLHAEGYLVTSRTTPQDTLFHVQIGPYATRKDADLIRQKLIGEGYTPIVK